MGASDRISDRAGRTSRRAGRGAYAIAFATALLVVAAGCDHGSSTQPLGPVPTPTPAPLAVDFAGAYDGSPESVAVELAYSTPAQPGFGLVVAIEAHELPNVDGVFFDLVFPPDRLVYRGFYSGPDSLIFATSVGTPGGEPGRLRCFFSHYGFTPYPVHGSGRLMEIYFDPIAEGTGEIQFEGYGLVQAETLKLRYGRLSWFGASIAVRR